MQMLNCLGDDEEGFCRLTLGEVFVLHDPVEEFAAAKILGNEVNVLAVIVHLHK